MIKIIIKHKGQSSLQYLMNYGWAILVSLVLVSYLYYSGALTLGDPTDEITGRDFNVFKMTKDSSVNYVDLPTSNEQCTYNLVFMYEGAKRIMVTDIMFQQPDPMPGFGFTEFHPVIQNRTNGPVLTPGDIFTLNFPTLDTHTNPNERSICPPSATRPQGYPPDTYYTPPYEWKVNMSIEYLLSGSNLTHYDRGVIYGRFT